MSITTVNRVRGTSRSGARRWRAWAVVGAALVGVLAAACGGSPAATSTTTKTSGPHRGGTIKEAFDAFPASLSPTVTAVSNVDGDQVNEAIFGLLGYENSTTGAVSLVFLKSMTPSANFKTWTLTLKPGITFSDGTPLNAAAIQYTIKQLVTPANSYEYLADMTGWTEKVVSTDVLQITLPAADAQFEAEMTQDFPYIGSPTAWAAEGNTGFGQKPVGAGAFILKSFVANTSITLVDNPKYDGPTVGPYVSQIDVNNFPTSHTQLVNALTSGEDNLAWLQGKAQVDPVVAAGLQAQNFPLGGGLWLSFNTKEKPFNNVLARQAVNIALNHQQLADSWAPGSTAMTEMFPTTSPYYNAADVNPPQNTTQAQADFNKLATEGDPVDFTVTDLVGYEGIAQYVQSHLNGFKNVSVKISMVQGPTYEKDSFNDTFQMIPQGFFFPNPWPTLAEGVVKGSSANYGQWNDPKVNAAVASLKLTTDPTKEKADWNIVLHEIQTQVPWFSSQAALLTTVYAKNVHNVVLVENGVLPLMEQIYIS